MKIAVSGTHSSGKSTLVEALSRALPGYEAFDEPYYLLETEGHRFSEPPSVENLELQLSRSIECTVGGGRDAIFERCPLDFLAYLLAKRNSGSLDIQGWIPRVRRALAELDLIVYLPLQSPDPIRTFTHARLRQEMDGHLRDLLEDDPWGLRLPLLRVSGTPAHRARQVLSYLSFTRGVSTSE